MDKHAIPPEYGYILSVFSHSPSLRGTAASLNMDPSRLVRKFQKMADEYGLLQKAGNKWIITEKGLKLNRWYDESVARQKLVLNEIPLIRIASFTWLAEQSLIPSLPALSQHFPGEYTWSFKTNASNLEQELINNRSDFVITGHPPNDPSIAHKKVFSKNWVVIIPSSWKKQVKGMNVLEQEEYLKSKPFIRLTLKSPHEILNFRPQVYSDIQIDGVIGVRTAVAQGSGWSCVPAMSILDMKDKVHALDVSTNLKDEVSYWWLRSRNDLSPVLKKLGNWLIDQGNY